MLLRLLLLLLLRALLRHLQHCCVTDCLLYPTCSSCPQGRAAGAQRHS